MKLKTSEAETIVLERVGTLPIEARGTKRKAGRPQTAEYLSNFYRVLERRGYQRFYYHVTTTTVVHWWDHQDILNNVQMELEELYGGIVELIAVRDIPGRSASPRTSHIFNFYFKIGPIPVPF